MLGNGIDVEGSPEEEKDIEKEPRDLREEIYLKRMANKYVMPVLPVKEVMIARPVSSMKVHSKNKFSYRILHVFIQNCIFITC